jgi:hypothetical protein
MKSPILLAAVAAFSFSVFAQDSGTPTAPAASAPVQGEIKQDKKELRQKRQIRNEAQKVVNEDRSQLKKDESSGASQAQIESDKQKLKQDRKTRNDAKKEVRRERRELRKDIREKNEAQHQ